MELPSWSEVTMEMRIWTAASCTQENVDIIITTFKGGVMYQGCVTVDNKNLDASIGDSQTCTQFTLSDSLRL